MSLRTLILPLFLLLTPTLAAFTYTTSEQRRANLTSPNYKITLSSPTATETALRAPDYLARFASITDFPILTHPDVQFRYADASIRPGRKFIRHYHPRTAELVYCIRGHLRSTFEYEGINGRVVAVDLKPGESTIIPTGLVHDAECLGPKRCYFIAIFKTADPGFVAV